MDGKEIYLKTSTNILIHDDFNVNIVEGNEKVTVESDIVNLYKQ